MQSLEQTPAKVYNHASTSFSVGSRLFADDAASTQFGVAAGGTKLNLVSEDVSNSENSNKHILH